MSVSVETLTWTWTRTSTRTRNYKIYHSTVIIIEKQVKYMSIIDTYFKKFDKPGREKFKQLCTELGFEYGEPKRKDLMYDCHFTYKGKKYIVEIKDRDPKIEKYDSYIIEKEQLDCILHWKHKLEADGCYFINFFGDKAYIFNLMDPRCLQNPSSQWMSLMTAIDRKKKVKKEIYLLDKNIALTYTLKSEPK